MSATVRAPLAGLLLFCIVQLLALYVWLPHNLIKISSTSQCFPSWNKTDLVSQSELQQGFILLNNLGKRNGLSDKELMVMFIQGLTGSESIVKKPEPGQLNIQGKRNSLLEVLRKAKERPMLHPGDGSSGKQGFGTESGKAFLPPLTNISDGEKKIAKLKGEEAGAVTTTKLQEGKVGNQGEKVWVANSSTRLQVDDDNKRSNNFNKIDLSAHRPDGLTESYKWYLSSNGSNPVNPHTYNLLINQPYICRPDGYQLDVFLLIVMISSPGSFRQRDMLRNSSLSATNMSGKLIRHVFLLGDSGLPKVTAMVHKEAAKYGDILMEDFKDSYRNLTLKTLMGLKWASVFCPQAKYVLKTDDDVYISFTNLIHLLEGAPSEGYMTGYVYRGTKPLRDKRTKWYISKEVYPRDIYPPYPCGIGYVMSGDLPSKIYEVSLSLPYIFLEDVYVGLCIEKLNVVPTVNPGFYTYRQDYEYCKFKKAYIIHTMKPPEIGEYWVQQKTRPANVTC